MAAKHTVAQLQKVIKQLQKGGDTYMLCEEAHAIIATLRSRRNIPAKTLNRLERSIEALCPVDFGSSGGTAIVAGDELGAWLIDFFVKNMLNGRQLTETETEEMTTVFNDEDAFQDAFQISRTTARNGGMQLIKEQEEKEALAAARRAALLHGSTTPNAAAQGGPVQGPLVVPKEPVVQPDKAPKGKKGKSREPPAEPATGDANGPGVIGSLGTAATGLINWGLGRSQGPVTRSTQSQQGPNPVDAQSSPFGGPEGAAFAAALREKHGMPNKTALELIADHERAQQLDDAARLNATGPGVPKPLPSNASMENAAVEQIVTSIMPGEGAGGSQPEAGNEEAGTGPSAAAQPDPAVPLAQSSGNAASGNAGDIIPEGAVDVPQGSDSMLLQDLAKKHPPNPADEAQSANKSPEAAEASYELADLSKIGEIYNEEKHSGMRLGTIQGLRTLAQIKRMVAPKDEWVQPGKNAAPVFFKNIYAILDNVSMGEDQKVHALEGLLANGSTRNTLNNHSKAEPVQRLFARLLPEYRDALQLLKDNRITHQAHASRHGNSSKLTELEERLRAIAILADLDF